MKFSEIYRPINKGLSKVEEILLRAPRNESFSGVAELGNFILKNKGKRLRPATALLFSGASSVGRPFKAGRTLLNTAAAIELIHAASLVHDDVIDDSSLRHNKLTVNSKWGNELAIVLGDYLYCAAFDIIADGGLNERVMRRIIHATRLMCEGEVLQIHERENSTLLKERYISIIEKKTASLFELSCRCGVMLSKGSKAREEAAAAFGLNFGIAFQMTDDYLDIASGQSSLGKTPGLDFKKGELTLPFLNLAAQSEQRNKIRKLIKSSESRSAFLELRRLFLNSPANDMTRNEILGYIRKARKSLDAFEGSPFKKSLYDITCYREDRAKV